MGSCLLALTLGPPLMPGLEGILQLIFCAHASPAPRLLDLLCSEQQRRSLHKELEFPSACREPDQHEGVKLGRYWGAMRRTGGGERQIPKRQ